MPRSSTRPLSIGLLAPACRGFNALDGGIGTYMADLAKGLAAEGHSVRVITPAPDKGFPETEAFPGVRFVTFDPTIPRWLYHIIRWRWQAHTAASWLWRARRAAAAVRRAHDAEPFDCIETSSSGLLPLTLLRSGRRPPVITRVATTAVQLVAHNASQSLWLNRLEQRWEKKLVRQSDALLTHTLRHREELIRQWNLHPASVHLVPLGITVPSDSELRPPTAGRSPRVLYVGRFEHRKGIDVLLASIPSVLAAVPAATFDLIGRDDDDYWQQRFWRENPTIPRERVRFHGKAGADALLAAYRDCDLFVAPSRYESFGLIYVEAMAWAKPVIGCRAGGIPEVVSDGGTGLLVEPGDATGLRDALLRLCLDPALRTQLGGQARQCVVERFSRAVFARSSAALYREIIASHETGNA